MAKKGLRNFNQFITTNFCLGEVCLDLKPSQPQVYLNIPLISADEVINFPLAIYYSYGLATSEPELIDNFRFSIAYRFAFVDDNHIDVEFPDGLVVRYTKEEDNIFKSEIDRSILIKQDVFDLAFTHIKYYLCFENGTIYEFYAILSSTFASAKLTKIIDERGKEINIYYDNTKMENIFKLLDLISDEFSGKDLIVEMGNEKRFIRNIRCEGQTAQTAIINNYERVGLRFSFFATVYKI